MYKRWDRAWLSPAFNWTQKIEPLLPLFCTLLLVSNHDWSASFWRQRFQRNFVEHMLDTLYALRFYTELHGQLYFQISSKQVVVRCFYTAFLLAPRLNFSYLISSANEHRRSFKRKILLNNNKKRILLSIFW